MNRPVASGSFRRLRDGLKKTSSPPLLKTFPYPCSDEEMIARYGMRYPTPEERAIFPSRRLVINVIKAKIINIANSPYLNPEVGIGHIVWAVESYPNSHQFRMLNGGLLQEEYNEIEWERAPDETPVTTPASAKRLQAIRQWRRKVRKGIRQNLQL